MPEYLDFITIDFWHIVMAIGNLLILSLIVKRFLFKPVNEILKKRREEVEKVYSQADTALADANADKQLYSEKIASAKSEAEEIIRTAVSRADERSGKILKETDRKSAELMKRTETELVLMRKKALNEMKDDISDIAVDLAQKILEREIDARAHDDLINAAITRLDEEQAL